MGGIDWTKLLNLGTNLPRLQPHLETPRPCLVGEIHHDALGRARRIPRVRPRRRFLRFRVSRMDGWLHVVGHGGVQARL